MKNDINNVASWYYHNNEIIKNEKNDIYLMIMCLFTKVAFEIENCETKIGRVYFKNKKLSIEDFKRTDREAKFDDKEEHILRALSKHYGYWNTKHIINNSPFSKLIEAKYFKSSESTFEITKEDIDTYLADDISDTLSYYENEDLEEFVYINGDYIFFIRGDIELDDEDLEYLDKYEGKRKHLDVYVDEDENIVIY